MKEMSETMNPASGRRELNLKITEVIPHVLFAGRTNLIFVEVRTNEGIFGIGEASLEGKTEAVVGAIRDVSGYLIGQDPTRIEHLWQIDLPPFVLAWRRGDRERDIRDRASALGHSRQSAGGAGV